MSFRRNQGTSLTLTVYTNLMCSLELIYFGNLEPLFVVLNRLWVRIVIEKQFSDIVFNFLI